MYPPNLKSVALHVPEIRGGSSVANPQSRGRGGHRGSGIVLSERALVSFYRPSIVTFFSSIFTRFRDIAAYVLQNGTFSLVSPKFPHVPAPGTRLIAF